MRYCLFCPRLFIIFNIVIDEELCNLRYNLSCDRRREFHLSLHEKSQIDTRLCSKNTGQKPVAPPCLAPVHYEHTAAAGVRFASLRCKSYVQYIGVGPSGGVPFAYLKWHTDPTLLSFLYLNMIRPCVATLTRGRLLRTRLRILRRPTCVVRKL
jgi:hypothetical protein